MRTYVLILSLFLLCITCNYLYNCKITENMIEDNGKMSCPTNDDYLNKYKAWSIESQRSSDIINNDLDVDTTIKEINNNTEIVSKTSIKNLSNWILNPENVFTWNLNRNDIIGNKIVISSTENRALKIGNIQVWGTGIYSSNSPDTTEQDWVKHKDTKVKLSSNAENPTLLDNSISDNIYLELGKEKNNSSNVNCKQGYTMTSCSCYSESGSCEGASIENENCIAKSKKCGGKVQAKALCVKFKNLDKKDINSTNTKKSNVGENKVQVSCNGTQLMTSCNCKASTDYKGNNQLCKGANIERDDENNPICIAYKNTDDFASNGQIHAVATCADIKGANLRYTKHSLKNRSSISNLGENAKSITKCKYNEKLIGCNCYSNPNDSNMNNICKGVDVKGDTDKICIAESIHNSMSQNSKYPVYADATCAQFDVNSKNCTNDILYTYDNENNKKDNACKTKNENNPETITVTLPKNINIKRIIIYKNGFGDNENNNGNDLYPIEVTIKNNNYDIISRVCDKNRSCKVVEPYPELPKELEGVKPNFYDELKEQKKIGVDNKFKGWYNTHSVNYKSYCRFVKDNDDNSKDHLSCIDPYTNEEIESQIYNEVSDGQHPFMKDITGNGLDDYCYCETNQSGRSTNNLKYLKNIGEDKFENPVLLENNSLYCQDGNLKKINNIKSNFLNCKDEYDKNNNENLAIDASFYNKHNQKYYIFKNIRMDGKKYVMFCEVDIDHTIGQDYPQFMSEDYWGNIPSKFYEHIDETIYSGNGSVYLISGSDVCEVKINEDQFNVVQEKTIEKTFNITEGDSEFKENIKTGFYKKDSDEKYVLIKDNKYIINERDNNNTQTNTTSSEHISKLLDPINNNNIKYNEIRTILNTYETKDDFTCIFMNNKIIEYDLNLSVINNEFDLYSDLYENLNWTVPLLPKIVKPSPIVRSTKNSQTPTL